MEQYILIQQQRHDFHYDFQVEQGEYLNIYVPRLILQPFVENAIEHGIDDGGFLSVHIGSDNGYIVFTVKDDGRGMSKEEIERVLSSMHEPAGSPSIGLRYIYTMAKSSFGDNAEIKIKSELGYGTEVILIIPEGNLSKDV